MVYLMKKDSKGIILSIDAIIALIPVLVVFLSLVNINIDYHTYHQKRCFQEAQDSVELMAQYMDPNGLSVLDKVSKALSDNTDPNMGVDAAKRVSDPFLNKTLGGRNYCFVELNYLNGREITSNCALEKSGDVAVAVKCNGEYMYRLYVW
jgi:hypothetical protein